MRTTEIKIPVVADSERRLIALSMAIYRDKTLVGVFAVGEKGLVQRTPSTILPPNVLMLLVRWSKHLFRQLT